MTEYTAGRWSLANAAIFFTESPEFEASYGQLDQDGFIRQLYRNVLGREGEEGGVAFWNGQMDAGMTRGTVLLRFAESPENIANSGTTSPALGEFNEGRTGAWFCSYRFNDGAPASHPGDVVNCADFETQQAAQDYFDYYAPRYGDVAGLDRDDNGIACESLPAA